MNKQVNGKVRSFFRQVVEKNRCRKGWWPNQRNKERLHNSLYRMVLVIRIHCNPKPLVIRTRKMKKKKKYYTCRVLNIFNRKRIMKYIKMVYHISKIPVHEMLEE